MPGWTRVGSGGPEYAVAAWAGYGGGPPGDGHWPAGCADGPPCGLPRRLAGSAGTRCLPGLPGRRTLLGRPIRAARCRSVRLGRVLPWRELRRWVLLGREILRWLLLGATGTKRRTWLTRAWVRCPALPSAGLPAARLRWSCLPPRRAGLPAARLRWSCLPPGRARLPGIGPRWSARRTLEARLPRAGRRRTALPHGWGLPVRADRVVGRRTVSRRLTVIPDTRRRGRTRLGMSRRG